MEALVVGASGRLGLQVVRGLRSRGVAVRALVRRATSAEQVASLREAGAAIVEGDLRDRESVDRACLGVRAVVSTATAVPRSEELGSLDEVDREGQIRLVCAAERARVGAFVFVSVMPMSIDYALQRAKQAVEARLAEGPLPATILRPVHFCETWLSPAAGFDPKGGTVTLFGDGCGRVNWVSTVDVARCCVEAATDPTRWGRQIVPLGGPQAVGVLELVTLCERVLGRRVSTRIVVSEGSLLEQLRTAATPRAEALAAISLGVARGLVAATEKVRSLLAGSWITADNYVTQVLKANHENH